RSIEEVFAETEASNQNTMAAATQRSPTGPPIQCHFCGRLGHKMADCREYDRLYSPPQPAVGTGTESYSQPSPSRPCYVCGDSTHWAKYCPNNTVVQDSLEGQMSPTYATARQVPVTSATQGERSKESIGRVIQAKLRNEQWQGDGRWRHFLVDTGSDLCLLPGDFCKDAQLSKSRIPHIMAANGTKIPLKGEVRLEMRILGPPEDSSPTEMFIVNFLVSDTLTEGLLGIDFLQQYGALWNFSTGRLEVGHKEYKPTSALRYEACRVVASRSLEIPACSEAIVPGSLRASSSRQLHGQLMTDAAVIKEGVAVAGALLPLRCENLPVRILNLVDQPYKIKAGG